MQAKKEVQEINSFKSKRLQEKFGKTMPDVLQINERSDDDNLSFVFNDDIDEAMLSLCTRIQQIKMDLHLTELDLKNIRKRVKRH